MKPYRIKKRSTQVPIKIYYVDKLPLPQPKIPLRLFVDVHKIEHHVEVFEEGKILYGPTAP